ncbi:hypothetical protein L7D48_07745 [Streptomyces sp. S1A]|uniref:hypothetical protein n=1 Tax=Streptomyces sp. ICN903 TaxID=2964654 RepID=UPI001EDBA144|nr:hypothetical protein [Streptomyces sp. ICN903]MCG3040461.1 hypothetical protein [Streptomyces sp. ICN903]
MLAEVVRDLISAMGSPSLRQVEMTCHISKSVLSALVNGKQKRPSKHVLEILHAHAAEHTEQRDLLPLEELEKLRLEVTGYSSQARRRCVACPAAVSASPSSGVEPAKEHVENAMQHLRTTEAPSVLPVPQPRGDRQHTETEAVAWPGFHGLAAHIEAGRTHDAAIILRYAGHTAAPQETAAAMVSCESSGLEEAVGDLLKYAVRRSDRDVMSIASSLLEQHCYALAGALLDLALSA